MFFDARLEYGPLLLNRIKIWGIGQQIKQMTTMMFYEVPGLARLVETRIVHNDGLPWLKYGEQGLPSNQVLNNSVLQYPGNLMGALNCLPSIAAIMLTRSFLCSVTLA